VIDRAFYPRALLEIQSPHNPSGAARKALAGLSACAARIICKVPFIPRPGREPSINIKNSPHHKEHEDHEAFSWGCMKVEACQKGESRFGSDSLFFFVDFVLFVVQQRNLVSMAV
jgi:hypothetical protein